MTEMQIPIRSLLYTKPDSRIASIMLKQSLVRRVKRATKMCPQIVVYIRKISAQIIV